ncbi:hypothetical protein C8R44DRAFT_973710 [Mycena epipterygia]|nr:hypothetical protein C8R44DRAFT_973710 [Mycena epipterygia]
MSTKTHELPLILSLSLVAFIALVSLVVYLLRLRARRRHLQEHSIRWHFPVLGFHGRRATGPPVLPLVLRPGSSVSATKDHSFSRFSWFISEDKLLSTQDYKDPVDFLESERTIEHPEPAMVRASTRSGPVLAF